MNEKEPKWMSSGYLQGAPTGEIDADKGIISGALAVSEGEAKGHGVNLDSEFVDTVIAQGNANSGGLKARFGHPNMCSTALGTFIGRWKNFTKDSITREDGSKASAARADLHLSNAASDTPHGDLKQYVTNMAKNESDMFGTSIVFTPGRSYRRDKNGEKAYRHVQYHFGGEVDIWYTREDGTRLSAEEEGELSEELFIECESLHACDTVDEPAANDGLFSSFTQETMAGQITEFLDLNPQVWGAIQSNPSIIEALARYGDNVDEFVKRYREYREQHTEGQNMTDERTSSEQLDEASVTEPEALETPEADTEDNEAAESVEESTEETEAVDTEGNTDEVEAETTEAAPAELSRDEFTRIADEFGNDIAVQTVRDGGDYQTALRAAYDAGQAELTELREAASVTTGKPAKVFAAPKDGKKTGKVFNTEK